MKRLLACLLAAAMVLSFVVVPTHEHEHGHVHAEEDTVGTVIVDTVVANPGEEVRIPLILENNTEKFAVIEIHLRLDDALDAMVVKTEDDPNTDEDETTGYSLNYDIEIEVEAKRTTYLFINDVPPHKNPVQIVLDSLSNTKEAVNGEFQTLIFTLSENAVPGRYEVAIEYFGCYNEDLEDLYYEQVSGAVIIPCKDNQHQWEIVESTATCTAPGETTYECAVCTQTKTEEGAALGHSFTNYVSNNDAKCGVDGTKTAKCDRCEATDTVTDEGTALQHSFTNYVSDGNATCTEDGTKTAECDNGCGAIDTIPDEGTRQDHNFGDYSYNNDATCTADGTQTRTCSMCGLEETVPAEGTMIPHSFTNYVSDGNATCEADGTKTAHCDYGCGATDTIPDEGSKDTVEHSFPAEYESDGNATCTADGTKSRVCTVCGEKETVTDEGSALGHAFTNYESDGNATCTEDGTKTAKCDRCDETDTVIDEGSALGHTPGERVNVKAPTEEETGYTGDVYCTVCEALLEKGEVIPVLDHVHVLNHVEATAPTCTEDGVIEHWICAKCGAMFSDAEGIYEITTTVDPALGHDFVEYTSNNDATCEGNGTETGHCSRCDETDTREVADSALGHEFVNYVSDGNATCEEDGTKTAKCERCDKTNTVIDEGSALGHTAGDAVIENVVDPTCTENGSHDEVVYCSVCEKELSRETVVVEALGHSFTDYVYNNDATCTEDGTETAKCDRCDETDTRVKEGTALGHGEMTHTEAKDPTCGEAGNVEHWTCPVCGKHYADAEGKTEIPAEDVEIEALEHTWGEWEITAEPSCTEAGSKTRKCSVCEDVETEEIPALGHDYEDVVTAPTVDAEGYTTHTCKVCGHTYVDNYTPKLDPSNPPTGDEFNFIGVTALMLISMTGVAALVLVEKKRNHR